MKKILTSIALLGLLATGCTNADNIISSTDETPGADIEDVAGGATSYLTFGLVTTSGTRALPDTNPDGNNYEYGKAYENSVKNVRFYFFNEDGDPVNVKKNPAKESKYDSFYDYSDKLNNFEEDVVTDDDPDSSLTVEKTINITLTLTPEKDKVPTRVVAILNPTAEMIADKTDYTQAQLEAMVDNYLPDPNKLDNSEENKGQFVITSSVYAKESKKINYTTIKLNEEGDLYQSVEEARNNKTTIFVERVVARIDLTVGKTTKTQNPNLQNPIIPVDKSGEEFTGTDKKDVYYTNKKYKKYNSPEGVEGEPIFVKFLGWTVTSTPVKSYLLKEIDATWKDVENGEAGLFNKVTEPWNALSYYRSFWAINPELNPAINENIKNGPAPEYEFYSYNEIIAGGKAHHAFAAGDENEPYASMYIQENAADATEGNSATPGLESKVIVAAQLLKPDGTAREIVEYGFMYYDADDLLQYFADQLSLVFYSNRNDKENSGLAKSDIEYKTQAQYLEQEGVDVTGGYFSYVALKKPATGSNDNKWYRDIEGVATAQTETQVNEYIQGVVSNRLLYWKEGKTYYYFPIQHLGGKDAEGEPGPGYYGVVRNHIYKADISGLTGLGTPVLDPNETIYPEHPTHDDYLLAAEIKVLAWRIVQQDYEFAW